MTGQRNIYTFIIPDPHPIPLEIIKHQEELVMVLGVIDANLYNNYVVSPFCVLAYIYCFLERD